MEILEILRMASLFVFLGALIYFFHINLKIFTSNIKDLKKIENESKNNVEKIVFSEYINRIKTYIKDKKIQKILDDVSLNIQEAKGYQLEIEDKMIVNDIEKKTLPTILNKYVTIKKNNKINELLYDNIYLLNESIKNINKKYNNEIEKEFIIESKILQQEYKKQQL